MNRPDGREANIDAKFAVFRGVARVSGGVLIQRLEEALRGDARLAGSCYSLAGTAIIPLANALQALSPEGAGFERQQRLAQWLRRVNSVLLCGPR
jgi:glutathione S-transferase